MHIFNETMGVCVLWGKVHIAVSDKKTRIRGRDPQEEVRFLWLRGRHQG